MKNSNHKATLIIGIGNDARGDDGLGWAFVKKLPQPSPDYDLEYRYQLQVEDAELISHYDTVVFVDAFHGSLPQGALLEPCQPVAGFEFSTHAVKPEAILALCKDLYHLPSQAYVLKIQGYQWDLGQGISKQAQHNLENTLTLWEKAAPSKFDKNQPAH